MCLGKRHLRMDADPMSRLLDRRRERLHTIGESDEIPGLVHETKSFRFPIRGNEVQIHSMQEFFPISLGDYNGRDLLEKAAQWNHVLDKKVA